MSNRDRDRDRDLLITGGHVVTLDPETGDLPEGDVLIRDGRIAAVGRTVEHAPDVTRVDARGRLVIPGMVDTHRHVWQGALGGSTGDVSLLGYVTRVIQGIAPGYTEDDIYIGTLWGALQALSAGVTTVADWAHNLGGPGHADANVRALHDSGVRGIFLHGGPGPDPAASSGNPPSGTPRMPGGSVTPCSPMAKAAGCAWAWPFGAPPSPAPRPPSGTSRSPGNSGCRSPSTWAWRASPAPSPNSTATVFSAPT
ncbi:hypothetical protein [Streptomyces prunicolor]